MRAIWRDAVIAESDGTVFYEGNHYFPPASLKESLLRPAALTTECPKKGTAHYFDIVVGDQTCSASAWYYPEPNPVAADIKGYVAFGKDIVVSE